MVEVPFQQIGKGQSARWVMQVVGKNGPIYNPSNLRFMAPGQGPSSQTILPSPTAIPLAISGLNLLLSAGTLVVAIRTMQLVKSLSRQVSAIDAKLDRMDEKLDGLLKNVQIIDTKVSEINLRHGIEFIWKQSLGPDFVDLQKLVFLQRDLDNLISGIPDFGPGKALGMSLSSDTTDKLKSICEFLFNLRHTIISQHNTAVANDSRHTIGCDDLEDFLDGAGRPDAVRQIVQCKGIVDRAERAVIKDIRSRFTFCTENDRKLIKVMYRNEVTHPIINSFDPFTVQILNDHYQREGSSKLDPAQFAADYRRFWLWHTDAGLIWRLSAELAWVKSGYQVNPRWAQLIDSPLNKQTEVYLAGEIPALAA